MIFREVQFDINLLNDSFSLNQSNFKAIDIHIFVENEIFFIENIKIEKEEEKESIFKLSYIITQNVESTSHIPVEVWYLNSENKDILGKH